MRRKGWSDLPPDLLREISGRLQVAADFVSFHAVCKPWRSSPDLLSQKKCLPWLLVPTESSCPLKLRCVFSKSTYRVLPPPYPRRTSWVCSADGATIRYLTVKQLRPTLHDPITGAVTDLPCFPQYYFCHWEENPCGIVYDDGTTFLYVISCVGNGGTARFRAALHRPGEAHWTLVARTFDASHRKGELCAAYHRGRILVNAEPSLCRVVTPGANSADDVLVPRTWIPDEYGGSYGERYSYILVSHGEVLWALVHVRLGSVRLVSVHVLEDAPAPEKLQWTRKEGHCLADRVLFLGSPNSFAVDASLLGGKGGCAYFVHHSSKTRIDVFRYNFIDGETERMERLPEEWDNEKCTWLVPQPTIAPVQEIIRRKLEAQKLKKQLKTAPITSPSRIFHIERFYEHRFRVLVYDLPLKVKNSELQLFFSQHGKLSSTEIIHNRNTKTAIGIVKIATMHSRQEDALDALESLDFDGCSLEVIVVNERRRRGRKGA